MNMSTRKILLKSLVSTIIAGAILTAVSFGLRLHAQQKDPRSQGKPPQMTPRLLPLNDTRVRPLTIGERLVFNVAWSNIPSAGRLELEVVDKGLFFGRESHQIRTKVQTMNEAWSLFGEIDNQYTTYLDSATGLPHRLVSSIRQGGRTKVTEDDLVIMDQTTQQVSEVGTTSTDQSLKMPPSTFDLPALLVALRRQPLPEGGRIKYSAIFGRKLIELDAEVTERRQISTQIGSFNAVCIRLNPRKGPVKGIDRYRTFLWLSDDESRTPLLIEAGMPLGDLRAELISATVGSTPRAGTPGLGPLSKDSPKADSRTAALPFAVGERLNYDISWGNFLNVGRANFEVRQFGLLNDTPVFEFYGEATSIGAARTMISVNDQISSFARATDRLEPLRTDIRLREGRRTKNDTAIFNHPGQVARLDNGTTVRIQPGTLDLISLFYAIRVSKLTIGESQRYDFLDANHRPQAVTIRAVKQETISSPLGSRNATQIDILSATTDSGSALIAQGWISNDRQRLPIFFATRTPFGEIRFQLVSATNTVAAQ